MNEIAHINRMKDWAVFFKHETAYLWLGINFDQKRNAWVDAITRKPIKYSNFVQERMENQTCAVVDHVSETCLYCMQVLAIIL